MTEKTNNLFIIFVYKLMHFIPAFKTYAPTQCNLFLILIWNIKFLKRIIFFFFQSVIVTLIINYLRDNHHNYFVNVIIYKIKRHSANILQKA